MDDIQAKIGKKIFEAALRGEIPASEDLLSKKDTITLKRCIYAAQVTGWRGGGCEWCMVVVIPSERASQEEQNGANFSFVAPSSEELRVRKGIRLKRLTIVHGFRPESGYC